ncbi:MAG: MBL fold metallo-hydrolase, partial [Alphaproteobacteria bacterium]|nr:MBL fold metallo-hydrolase [Alphaproteobacteria bacterium]
PVSQWIAACDTIEALAPERVVPGHGPLATLAEVRRCRDYLVWLTTEVRQRHDAGLGVLQAALDLDGRDFADWNEDERLVANVHALYRELDGVTGPVDARHVFGLMAAYRSRRARTDGR